MKAIYYIFWTLSLRDEVLNVGGVIRTELSLPTIVDIKMEECNSKRNVKGRRRVGAFGVNGNRTQHSTTRIEKWAVQEQKVDDLLYIQFISFRSWYLIGSNQQSNEVGEHKSTH